METNRVNRTFLLCLDISKILLDKRRKMCYTYKKEVKIPFKLARRG